jgi:hypothetical protein
MKSRRRRSNADDGEIERESDEEQPRTNVSEATDNLVREEKDVRKDFANKQLNVPRSGKFFLHDDRRRQGTSKKYHGANK